ncbi:MULTISPECIES: oligosaccharide flippase family protein [unclassified Sphingomonas]|uniref:oligosaccharide flippase family protein n=1 Tax=unclassified Sphingomonas TaxID=196159 RepID=UPI001F55B75F|nr:MULTISPECIES: oligosaccharide flippase family protein [unclassified Sphingomonas]
MVVARLTNWASNAQSLRQRATLASVWAVGGFGLQRVLQLASNLVLTRLLFPEAFGLMTLANVILIGIAMFSDIGIKPAIVQSEEGGSESYLNTAWTVQVIRGFILWGVCCLIAWPAALLYRQPILFPLLCVLGATAAINGFGSTTLALREKRLHLGALTTVQVVGQFMTLTITALFAWLLGSVWALAYGAVVGALAYTALGFVALPGHRHRLYLDPVAAKKLLSFGRWIFVSTMVTFLGGQGIRAIQGGLIPIETLGILGIAQTFATMPAELAAQVQNLVGFPALSEARVHGKERFLGTFDKIRTRILISSLPLFFVLALAAGPIIWSLYDGRYHAAAGFMALLCVTGPIGIVAAGYQSAFMALGKVRLYANLMAVFMVTRVVGTVAGFYIGGTIGMLIGGGAGTFLGYTYVAYMAAKEGLFSAKVDAVCLLLIVVMSVAVKFFYF